jgi:hypothetical protein
VGNTAFYPQAVCRTRTDEPRLLDRLIIAGRASRALQPKGCPQTLAAPFNINIEKEL